MFTINIKYLRVLMKKIKFSAVLLIMYKDGKKK